MGCWNKTCGLSNLPIEDSFNSEVYVFVLLKKNYTDYNSTRFQYDPILMPFVADYTGYGDGENSRGIGFPLVMESIKNNISKKTEINPEYLEYIDERSFYDLAFRKKLFVEYGFSGETQVDFTMMRKDVVDYILDNYSYMDWPSKHYCNFRDIVADIKPMILEAIEIKKRKGRFNFIYNFEIEEGNKAAKWLSYCQGISDGIFDFHGICDECLTDPTEANIIHLEEILTEYLKGIYIERYMSNIRKVWLPGTHEGSQEYATQEYKVLIDAMSKVLSKNDEDVRDD